jgi:hypothetical protein
VADPAAGLVHLLDPSGEIVALSPAEAAAAAPLGYVLAQPEQVAAFQQAEAARAKYGSTGQAAIAGLESAGSALTFGLSTAAERALGVPAEDIAGRAEANPIASGAGTALGIAAPLVLTAGASAPASAAMAAAKGAARLTGPALAAGANRAVTGAVKAALPEASGLAGQIAARAASLGAGSAVEGAAYGLGQVVHEAALGDPHLTAQSALAEIGLTAALGGALGGLVGVGEVGIPAVARKARDAIGNAFGKAKSGVESWYAGAEKVHGVPKGTAEVLLEHKLEMATLEQTAPGIADVISKAPPETAASILGGADKFGALERQFPGIAKTLSRARPDTLNVILSKADEYATLEREFPGTLRQLSAAEPSTAEYLRENWKLIIRDPVERVKLAESVRKGGQGVIDSVDASFRKAYGEMMKVGAPDLLADAKPQAIIDAYGSLWAKAADAIGEMEARPSLFDPYYPARLRVVLEDIAKDTADGTLSGAARKATNLSPEEYLYHVTPESNAAAIRREGLRPDAPKIAEGGPHGDTKAVFLADHETVDVYRELYGAGDEGVVVFRVPKSAVREIEEDAASEGVAFLTRERIPPSALEVEVAGAWSPAASGGEIDPVTAFRHLTRLRQEIGDKISWGKAGLLPPAERDAQQLMKGIYGEISKALRSEEVFGAAGARKAELDEAFAAWKRITERRPGAQLGKSEKGTSNFNFLLMQSGSLSPNKMNAWFNHLADDTGALKTQAWSEMMDAAKRAVDAVENLHKAAPTTAFDREAVASVIDKTAKATEDARQRFMVTQTKNALDPSAILRGSHPALMAAPSGEAASQVVGAAQAASRFAGPLSSTVKVVLSPISTAVDTAKSFPKGVAALAALERLGKSVASAIDSGASMLVRGSAKAAYVGRAEVSAGVARSFGADLDHATRTFQRRAREIQGLAQDPDQMHKALLAQNDGIEEHAPETAQALSVASARAVAFLAAKMPKAPQRGPLAPKWQPNQAEIAKWNRYYEAVQRPTSVLKQAAAGTLTPEAVEAVAVVYPELYARIQAALVDKIAGHSGAIPYPSRLMASLLMGQDLDGTAGLTGKHRAAFAGPSGKPSGMVPAPIRPTAGGASKITLSTRSLTPQQRAAQR